MDSITIRAGRKEDMSQIYDMIKQLAEFEKMADQVKISTKTLISDGFGPNPAFATFVACPATDVNKIVGYALYYPCYSTWVGKSVFLEDLFVLPEHRKGGVGKKLFLAVAKLAHESSKRMDFHVLSWNPAKDFYKALGCVNLTQEEDWNVYRLHNEDLAEVIKDLI